MSGYGTDRGQLAELDLWQVICNGEEVLVTSGTMESYTVDVWSGNHPFYTKSDTAMLSDDGRVSLDTLPSSHKSESASEPSGVLVPSGELENQQEPSQWGGL